MTQTAQAFGNITSANATLVLKAATVFPAGVTLEQFATDQSVTQDEITTAETRMGVDGYMAAGWIPSIKVITLMLEASSPSVEPLAQLYQAEEQARTKYEITLTARIPSIGKVFTWSGGVLKSGTPFPAAKKVLEPTSWKFDFARFEISTI